MNFFKKLFGSNEKANLDPRGLLEESARTLISLSGFDVDVAVTEETSEDSEPLLVVEFFGPDEDFLCQKEGLLLESIQIFLKRVLQNRWSEEKLHILVDAAGYSEANEKQLHDLADKLRQAVLTKKRPVYVRALPPKDRKIVHRFLSEDDRIKTRSVGEGTFKKIKIFLANQPDSSERESHEASE
jgi:spoIIIJ-associated protein